jgi:hypothetical protein
MENSSKLIIGREKICNAYSIGKDTFYELIKMGAPITKINNRHAIHRETFEDFVKKLTLKGSSK